MTRVHFQILARALAGCIVRRRLPDVHGGVGELGEFIEEARRTLHDIVLTSYVWRGRFDGLRDVRGIAGRTLSDARTSSARLELTAALAFIETLVDSNVRRDGIDSERAERIKARIAVAVFHTDDDGVAGRSTEAFRIYRDDLVRQLSIETGREVRVVARQITASGIAQQLDAVMKALHGLLAHTAVPRSSAQCLV